MAQIRKTDTKAAIKEALVSLLEEKNFEEISVSHITRLAGINRGTFYLHYLDKYDMADQMMLDMKTIFQQFIENSYLNPYEIILQALTYVYENKSFIRAISKSTYFNMSSFIKDLIRQQIDQSPEFQTLVHETYKIPEQYAREAMVSSLTGVVLLWIESGLSESPIEMANILFKVLGA
ncbi:TetR-like transcriptional regulator [Streptococcus varani]|uniref:TetR-like transcriptional regulator n=1 Tax=Streptococcus varani TaxID=1608583 RepID=A0A0E4CT18_9STRE|nr:TetR/AcrR family transcriptional regulator C-terminal domain-containing protein [Streptococcus varani]CQR25263.1 TetR-like transcriptional regulator [Streptococcus varani]